MARVRDLWFKTVKGPDGSKVKVPTSRHPGNGGNPSANRWLAIWIGPDHREQAKTFAVKARAEKYLENIGHNWCLVPDCRHDAVTEPPVILCADHRDLLIRQCTRRCPQVHEPYVYFIRNGSRIKIGWSTNVKSRVQQLSLPPSALLLQIPGGSREEGFLHRKFASARVGRTEWFEATAELETFIAAKIAERESAA